MKLGLAIVLLLFSAIANAENISCSYTYNQYSRRIDNSCTNKLPPPALTPNENVLLLSRKVKSCLIVMEFDPVKKQPRVTRRVCE